MNKEVSNVQILQAVVQLLKKQNKLFPFQEIAICGNLFYYMSYFKVGIKKEKTMAKKKYYVVWVGKKTGIFETWDECKQQVLGVKGAKYKSFPTKQEAEAAFKKGPATRESKSSVNKGKPAKQVSSTYIEESISVDRSEKCVQRKFLA